MRILFVLLSFLITTTLDADELKIAAIVGKDPITMLDYEERLIFTLATSGMQNTEEARKQIGPQVLNAMIEEKLKLQEAEKYKIDVSDLDIKREWDRIEKQNNVPDGQIQKVIMQLHLRPSVFRDQLRADIAWYKYIGARYRPTITVGESEIKQHLDKMKKAEIEPAFLLSEIVLTYENASEKQKIQKTAQHLHEQLNAGGNFQALAQEMSQGITAEKGGDLGWLSQHQLSKKVINQNNKKMGDLIAKMKPGQVSEPLETEEGFHLVLLRDQRQGQDKLESQGSEVGYKIRQLYLPVEGKGGQSEKAECKRRLEAVRRKLKGPEDISPAQRELGGLQPPERWVKLAEFEKPIQAELQKLDIHQTTPALAMENGYTVIMLCEKNDKMDASTQQRERAKEELLSVKLHMLARRHLRDLKHAAHIDNRVKA